MVEIGHFALVLALAIAVAQSIVPFIGVRRNDHAMMALADACAISVCAMIAVSFAALVHAYVGSDFSVKNVFENSHSLKPLLYKISGTWGNHEGSMLLWVLILSLFGALVALFGRNLPASLRACVLGVQGWIGSAFLLFVLITSNPFTRLIPAPIEGRDLNPVLQDIGLAIHPPLLYLGYVGFSISFSFAVAALIDGRVDAAWARWVRPWTLAAWVFLTAGIAMGSFWAYYELGWGGWWFWDPVENASFMPWLSGTALLHSAIVMEKRSALKIWTILLSIITFSLSLLGTFLVRSGVLTSVHAFASDPQRGIFILAILILFIGGSLTLFAFRAHLLNAGGLFQPISREGALVLNNLFLSTMTATVLIGTLYPLVVEAISGDKISVGAPFFNPTFGMLSVPLLLALPFGPLLAWKRADLYGAAQRLFFAFAIALGIGLAMLLFYDRGNLFTAVGLALAAWLILGSLTDLLLKGAVGRRDLRVFFARLKGLPGSAWGTSLGHMGLGLTVLGIVSVTSFQSEHIATLATGDTMKVDGYTLVLNDVVNVDGPNYSASEVHFVLKNASGDVIAPIVASKRLYQARKMPTTEAGILRLGFSHVYVSLGDVGQNGKSIVVRVWVKPLVTLIWLGSLVMVFGGIISLCDRRLRIGAPARKIKKARALT